jgi:signal transduction histidine kinase
VTSDAPRTIDHDLRSLVEALPFDVWVRDPDHVCVYANEAARRRWPRLVGQLDVDGAPDAEVAAIWRGNNARALAGEIVRGEVRYRIDGEHRIFHNVLAPIRVDGEIRGTVGANVDITDQRGAERRAEALGTLLGSIFAHAPIAIGVRGVREGDLVHLADNPRAAAFFGQPAAQLEGRSDRELGVPQALVDVSLASWRAALATDAPVPFELSLPTPEGTRAFVGKLAPIPGFSEAGEPRFVFLGEDVTHKRALEAGLLRADRLAGLGALAAGIGHEIKNPAQYVLTYLTHAAERLEGSPYGMLRGEVADVLADVRGATQGVQRIATIVKDLGRLARPSPPHIEAIDVRAVLDSVLTLAAGHLRAHAKVERLDDPALPRAAGDGVRLAQVLLNLLTNAVQAFGERYGRLRIETRATAEAVRIEVVDDGPGVPPELRARLFQPFVTSKDVASNSGLGLYVSKQIVDSMNGRIGLEPSEPTGTRAWIELPIASS